MADPVWALPSNANGEHSVFLVAIIERPSADAADPILLVSETLGGVPGALWRSLGEPGGSLGAPYTLYMNVIYIECYVNEGLFAHIHCIWTPFTMKSL